MNFFTLDEFRNTYSDYSSYSIPSWYITASCEMIYSMVGSKYKDSSWDADSVPTAIKKASMEQLRFMVDHDIPFVDSQTFEQGGMMKIKLKSDYSTLALRMLGNAGYLYRGNPINSNMSLNIPFGD